jgi:hypothetical protein
MTRRSPLHIVYWNANSVRHKLPLVEMTLHSTPRIHLLFICETRLYTADDISPVADYTIHSFPHPQHDNSSQTRAGGIAVFIHSSVRFSFLPTFIPSPPFTSSSQLLWLQLASRGRSTTLLGFIYLSPSASPLDRKQLLSSIADTISTRAANTPVVVAGDFNAHHPLWSATTQAPNNAGEELAACANSLSLTCLNPIFMPSQSTFIRPDAKAVLDLVFTNCESRVAALTSLPTVANSPLCSDHVALSLHLHSSTAQVPQNTTHDNSSPEWRWNYAKADWLCFSACLTILLQSEAFHTPFEAEAAITSVESPSAQQLIDRMEQQLVESLTQAAEYSIPRKRVIRGHSHHWFQLPGVREAINHKCRTLRLLRKDRSNTPLRHAYLIAKRAAEAAVASAKELSLQQQLQQLEQPDLHGKLLWSALQRVGGAGDGMTPSLHTIVNERKQLPPSTQHSIDNLALFFSKAGKCPNRAAEAPEVTAFHTSVDAVLEAETALEITPTLPLIHTVDVASLLRQQSCNTSSGPDSVPPHFLRHGGEALASALTLLFNLSLQLGVVPTRWRLAHVIGLLKGRKLDPSSPSSYRPISLTSTLARIFERALYPLIWSKVETHIHPHQHGFRARHSTLDNLYHLLSTVYRALREQHTRRTENRALPVAFLDLVKAFDRVDHRILLFRLWSYGVRGRLWRWTRAFLRGRQFRVIYRNQLSALFTLSEGVPQGCVLAPLLFAVFINSLPFVIHMRARHVLVTLFADDIAIAPLVHANNGRDHQLQLALNAATGWAHENGMEFSADKSAVVLFSSQEESCRADSIDKFNEGPPAALRGMLQPRQLFSSFASDAATSRAGAIPPIARSFSLRQSAPAISYSSPRRAQSNHPRLYYSPSSPLLASPHSSNSPSSNSWLSRLPSFRLCNFLLPMRTSYRYVGVILQNNGRWQQQTTRVLQTAQLACMQVMRLLPFAAKPPPAVSPHFSSIRQLCRGYIMPKVSYAIAFWRPCASTVDQLQSILLRPLRRHLRLPSTTHQIAIQAECRFPHLSRIREAQQLSYFNRIHQRTADDPTHQHFHAEYARSFSLDTSEPHYARCITVETREFERRWSLFVATSMPDDAIRRRQDELAWQEFRSIDSATTRRLHTLKNRDRRSHYLYAESSYAASIRASFRLNVALTLDRLHRMHQVDSDKCTNCCLPIRRTRAAAACTVPSVVESIEHVLLECSHFQAERDLTAARVASLLEPNDDPQLSLPHLLGGDTIYTRDEHNRRGKREISHSLLSSLLLATLPLVQLIFLHLQERIT